MIKIDEKRAIIKNVLFFVKLILPASAESMLMVRKTTANAKIEIHNFILMMLGLEEVLTN